jgi:two-component system, OmpR family, response regulator MprA
VANSTVCIGSRTSNHPSLRSKTGDALKAGDSPADEGEMKLRGAGELIAQVRALRQRDGGGRELLRFDDLSLDLTTRDVRRRGRRIEVTPTEFALLELFLRNPNRVLTRRDLFTRVWGFDFGSASNSLNVYVGYLRRKTEAGGEPRLLHTVRGVGYVLRRGS